MLFKEHLVILRGGGDLATGVAYRLYRAGFPLIVLELAQPLVVRRRVALATAVLEGRVEVEGLVGQRVETAAQAEQVALSGEQIPVLVQPELAPLLDGLYFAVTRQYPVSVVVDARMAKRNLDTRADQAPLVVALGPGFTAGEDADAVVETMRGHGMGRVLWQGRALANTGTPGTVAGYDRERVLRAPAAGPAEWQVEIGDRVKEGQTLGSVAGKPIDAPFDGVVRGLIATGTEVKPGLKIGDVDPRGDPEAASLISDKALAIGGGVLEAILTWLNREKSDAHRARNGHE